MTSSLRLLVVEDQELDAELMLAELERSGLRFSYDRVDTREAFLEKLEPAPDVILCDYNLPSFDALEALDLVRERKIEAPLIIISGSIGEETAVKAMKRGAADYLLKDRLGRLPAAISQALEQKEWQDAAKRAEEALRESEFKYRRLFEQLRDAAYLANAATARIIDLNEEGERLLGLERAAILGMRANQFLSASAAQRIFAPTNGSSETRRENDFEAEINLPSKVSIPVEISASHLTIHGHALVLVLVRDLNERRVDLETARDREDRWEELVVLQRELLLAHGKSDLLAAFGQGVKTLISADRVSVMLEDESGAELETASIGQEPVTDSQLHEAPARERVEHAQTALHQAPTKRFWRVFQDELHFAGRPTGYLRLTVEKQESLSEMEVELVRHALQYITALMEGVVSK